MFTETACCLSAFLVDIPWICLLSGQERASVWDAVQAGVGAACTDFMRGGLSAAGLTAWSRPDIEVERIVTVRFNLMRDALLRVVLQSAVKCRM